jgi:hypothetical protein
VAPKRRRDPRPQGRPDIQFRPGLAAETLRELAPLLAEEGIDVDNLDATDELTLQRALARAVERHNMALFTPVGAARELALATLRQAVKVLTDDDDAGRATAILDQAQPDSPDNSVPTVSACIGTALSLLDDWLGGQHPEAPQRLAERVRLPNRRWPGDRAARDILALAAKGRAFNSLGPLLTRQGGMNVLYGSATALAATLDAWAITTNTPTMELARTTIR